MTIPGLTINQATFPLKDGSRGVIAVFIYAGSNDPRPILDWACDEFTKDSDEPYITLIDAQMDCPWCRVIVSNPDQMEQMSFSDYMTILNRDRKLNELLNESDS